ARGRPRSKDACSRPCAVAGRGPSARTSAASAGASRRARPRRRSCSADGRPSALPPRMDDESCEERADDDGERDPNAGAPKCVPEQPGEKPEKSLETAELRRGSAGDNSAPSGRAHSETLAAFFGGLRLGGLLRALLE